MKIHCYWLSHLALAVCSAELLPVVAAEPTIATTPNPPAQAIADAATQGKTIFIMFYKEPNAAADAMIATLKASPLIKSRQATWTSVRVNDPAERAVAEKFKVTRAPMPSLVGVHPNGAVTGVFPTKVTSTELASCVISPKMAECLKQLQDNRLVLICVQTEPGQTLPVGVREFKADPHFAKRTSIITVSSNDEHEADFLTGMEVDPAQTTSPVTVFLAPPGALVGKFEVAATKSQLATSLAAAGKCCNDKNCKHNHSTTKK